MNTNKIITSMNKIQLTLCSVQTHFSKKLDELLLQTELTCVFLL